MKLPQGLRAVIFDFDGVIVDSEPLHFRLFQRLLGEEGVPLTREDYDAIYLGMDDRECFSEALSRNGKTSALPKVPEMIDRKSRMLMAEIAEKPPVLPGAVDLVRALAKSVPLVICSGALRREIQAMLEHAGILPCFSGIVSAEDVSHGKPHPEGFTKALALLNRTRNPTPPIAPSACLVIEDSLAGIAGAKAAGMRCLAVGNSYPAAALKQAGADRVVATLRDDPLGEVTLLFA
ncbi:MAG: HAD family phosphatase [Nitrospirota bacterium]